MLNIYSLHIFDDNSICIKEAYNIQPIVQTEYLRSNDTLSF